MPGQLFVISAPSGTGKSTIIEALRKRVESLGYSVSHTSRKQRGHEQEGVDYYFVDREIFSRMIEEGAFVEWAQVYNEFYGTSFSSLNSQTEAGLDVLLDLDSKGAKRIKAAFEENADLIYILPPSFEALERRLRERGTDSEKEIRARMEEAHFEVKESLWYDYIVVNDSLEKAIEEVKCIIVSRRCRAPRRAEWVRKTFDISGGD